MQRKMILLLAAAALGAAPAGAQNAATNTAPPANTVDATAANTMNTTAPAPAPAPMDNTVAVPGTTTTAPVAEPPTTGETGYVTADKGSGIPWGLIGLVGLVGLLGRRRRTE